MAAPAPDARVAPTVLMIKNGWKSLVTFSEDPDISIYEKAVTPFGIDNGETINITTQHNNLVVTKAPNALYEVTDGQFTFAYSPSQLAGLKALKGVNQTITYTFPNGDTWAVYGYLKSAIFGVLERGTYPEGTAVIIHTNIDPTDGSEAEPVYTAYVAPP